MLLRGISDRNKTMSGDKVTMIGRSRDTTPTRNEFDDNGDKTPPRSDRERVRKGRKRRLDTDDADNNSNNNIIINNGNKIEEKNSNGKNIVLPELKIAKIEKIKYPVVAGITLSTTNLNKLLPPGFKVVPFPDDYTPLNEIPPDFSLFESNNSNNQSLLAYNEENALVSSGLNMQSIYQVPDLNDLQQFTDLDMKVFKKLLTLGKTDVSTLPVEERTEIKCMKLILKVKNGSAASRKIALKSFTDNIKSFGPELILKIVIPLLGDSAIDEQGRHLLIKLTNRVIFTIEDGVKPFTPQLMNVVMPLLIDENRIARLEGRDLISMISKAVGLVEMINVLRPDLSNEDEQVRSLVSKTFAVIANSLGLQTVIPFINIICRSKNDWKIRHTGIKIIQQIAILVGSSILPYLTNFVPCLLKNIQDDMLNLRTASASTISTLADACAPYGFEFFERLVKPLNNGLKSHRGRALSYFIKGFGSLVPLMDIDDANFYAFELMNLMKKEALSPDDDMKRAILLTLERICLIDGIDKNIIHKSEVDRAFFKHFWSRRVAIDRKLNTLCINACYALSLKIGVLKIVVAILPSMKDESEAYRRMGLEASDKVIADFGSFDLDDKTITRLMNGLLYCFQHQNLDNKHTNMVVLNGFANILNNLGIRAKPHVTAIVSAILYRLKNKDAEVREQAADFISKIVNVLKVCSQDDLIIRLGTILYESLGEVYPDVLGSLLNALRATIQAVNSIDSLNPSISQILATLTPILRNRHEKVQEMTIPLIGDISIRASDYISHKEWMRISFELLEMLKAYKKSIRKSANKTFGLIAKVIGPADALVPLLNNLRVQERQLRVCTSVAIGIVAEKCFPYTVLPALMNEYRVPDKNVQNGVLKSFGFMFEYIGEMGSDYIYATTPLLLDALTDRDLVHRQIASNVVKHMALGNYCQGYEDAFINFLNLIWPNIFETSPHVINQVIESIESLAIVLGPGIILSYTWVGLFHPARKVRECYWKIFNNIYMNNLHSVVPYYPRFDQIMPELGPHFLEEDEAPTDLGVEEFDLWV